MKFIKQDLKRLGHTGFAVDGEDGKKLTGIIVTRETANIEIIMIRNILEQCFPKYKIVGEEDYFVQGREPFDCLVTVDMPFEEYLEIEVE